MPRYRFRVEYAPIGPGMKRTRSVTKEIDVTPRAAARMAAKAIREGRGAVRSATVLGATNNIVNVRCDYSIRPRKPTRRVERSFARCTIDPIFRRQLNKQR